MDEKEINEEQAHGISDYIYLDSRRYDKGGEEE